ncbi:AMP-binding protein [Carboxylicivirga caseinilyticus]|uniref:AMP-binding protein n=1 Tax=Carboxylicivirga caseinilyticus TaxID=3417572 RepID=UPI003D33009C|nr:AMP-binding protein [Marinilabiliaceae bacterium A049]
MFGQFILSNLICIFERYKDSNAFHICNLNYTYLEFSKTISKIRTQLQKEDFSSKNIGLIANNDLETYAAIVAIWLEGLAYVPLHPCYPDDRKKEIINDAKLDLIIDSSGNIEIEEVKLIKSKELTFREFNLEHKKVNDDQLAYILYTSGSTGKPKGVPISRLNLASFVHSFNHLGIELSKEDRCLQYFDLTFDISIQSYLIPLLKGACIYTVSHESIKPVVAIELMEVHKITFAAIPPSMIWYLRSYFDEIELPYLKTNILCAEASAVQLIDEWKHCIPNARILNLYGPTEATIYCTYSEFYRNALNKELNGMMTIGKPFKSIRIVVIDEDDCIQSVNGMGELCISGETVTQGYWNNIEKNKSSFVYKIIDGEEYRFYRTGDNCFIDEEGDIMLAGRLDHQVKVQGYRIELGEIEAHARVFLNGANAVAITFRNKSGLMQIALLLENVIFDYIKLDQFLRKKLPPYMIPSKYKMLELLPLNSNGKVDRLALKKLYE